MKGTQIVNEKEKPRVLIGVWVPQALRDKLRARAARQEHSVSGLLRFLLEREVGD